VEKWGEGVRGESGFSSLGIVVGATYSEDMRFLREEFPSLLFLVPVVVLEHTLPSLYCAGTFWLMKTWGHRLSCGFRT